MTRIVIGIDGGGTHTRAMAASLDGRVLSYVESGGANPSHNATPKENVRSAIEKAIAEAGAEPCDVASLVSGFAGLDSPEDHVWAEEFTALSGLGCPRLQVNDAVIAHAGALRSKPGIIVILGTGSIIFAVTDLGRHVRNYDFRHYAPAAARHLAYEAVHRMIAGEYRPADEGFILEVLAGLGAPDVAALREMGIDGFGSNRQDANRRFGHIGPLVTKAASCGIPLAQSVCDAGIKTVETGIRMLGQCFEGEEVAVSLIGSVARSAYFDLTLRVKLGGENPNKKYTVVKPALSPVAGAVLLGLEKAGVEVSESVVQHLAHHKKAGYED